MLNTFLCITNLLFPLHPSIKAIKNENKGSFVRFYSFHQTKNLIALANYQEKIIKETLKANKFHNYKPAAELLATLVEEWLKNQTTEKIIFVPIPLGEKRQEERGYNQVTRILENIHTEKNIFISPLLRRRRETLPQTKLHRDDRLQNIKGAFTLNEVELNKNNQDLKLNPDCLFVIVDDVITTGATLDEACKVLKRVLPKKQRVISLALSH